MIPNITFTIPQPKPIICNHINITKFLATVIPNDGVTYNGELYDIAECSKSINGLKVYYRQLPNEKRPTKIMIQDKFMGELHDSRPYKIGLTVSGYINDDNKFVIVNVLHNHLTYKENTHKFGLYIN